MSLLYWYFDNVLVIAIFHAFWNCISGLVFGFNLSGIKLSDSIFTVAAIIPMIPGVYAYKAMIGMVQLHHFGFSEIRFENAISAFLNTTFILGAIVFGLALPGLLFYREKPVV